MFCYMFSVCLDFWISEFMDFCFFISKTTMLFAFKSSPPVAATGYNSRVFQNDRACAAAAAAG
jgi:hypothetical protein